MFPCQDGSKERLSLVAEIDPPVAVVPKRDKLGCWQTKGGAFYQLGSSFLAMATFVRGTSGRGMLLEGWRHG